MTLVELRLWRVEIETGNRALVCPLEANNPRNAVERRRADPRGGFSIGTMGKEAEPGTVAIWRS